MAGTVLFLRRCSLLLAMVVVAVAAAAQPMDVTSLGVVGDGQTDCTELLQTALNERVGQLYFPEGVYLLGALQVPGSTTIECSPRSVLRINPARVAKGGLLELRGDRITLDGLKFDLSLLATEEQTELQSLIHAQGVASLHITGLQAAPDSPMDLSVAQLDRCQDIEIDHCEIRNLFSLVSTSFCARLSVHDNHAEHCHYITLFSTGSEWLRHYANWSSHVRHQCQWWGGDSNDLEHNWVPDGTANVYRRGLRPGDEGYCANTAGAYDILVQNNYAEYGITLAWGSKGQNVVIDGNIARFMDDMAYDTEGTENVIISNNISVNSRFYGIGCYFWSQRILITGNLIMVLDEGEQRYKGHFLRLHGPHSADHFGAGKALVSGNLFVNECDAPRMALVEACRDVNFSGNKFNDGFVTTINTSRLVTLTDNQFEWSLPVNHSAISLAPGMLEGIVRNNIFRRLPNAPQPDPEHATIYAQAGDERSRILESNLIEGWRYAVTCQSTAQEQPARFIVRNNTSDGEILFRGAEGSYQRLVRDNIDMTSMGPAIVKELPAPQNQ